MQFDLTLTTFCAIPRIACRGADGWRESQGPDPSPEHPVQFTLHPLAGLPACRYQSLISGGTTPFPTKRQWSVHCLSGHGRRGGCANAVYKRPRRIPFSPVAVRHQRYVLALYGWFLSSATGPNSGKIRHWQSDDSLWTLVLRYQQCLDSLSFGYALTDWGEVILEDLPTFCWPFHICFRDLAVWLWPGKVCITVSQNRIFLLKGP